MLDRLKHLTVFTDPTCLADLPGLDEVARLLAALINLAAALLRRHAERRPRVESPRCRSRRPDAQARRRESR